MHILEKLALHRYLLFKDAEFEFKRGLSQVGGANGSGKSLLFSGLPTILSTLYAGNEWEKPSKGSSIDLYFQKDKTDIHYNITTNSSAKHLIELNGKDQHAHKKGDAVSLLSKHWTIPQALFESTIFLRGKTEHPLSSGRPGERSKWLADALDLNTVYDAFLEEANANVKRAQAAISKAEVLSDELSHAERQIPESSISKKRAAKAQRILDNYKDKLKQLPKEAEALSMLVSIISQMAELPYVSSSVKTLQAKLDEAARQYAKLEAQQEAYENNSEVETKREKLQAAIKKLRNEGANPNLDVKLAAKKFAKMERLAEQWEIDYEAYCDQDTIRSKVKEAKSFPFKTVSLEEAEQTLSALVFRLGKRLEEVESISELGDATKCPTCGNKLNAKHREKELRKLKLECKVLPESIEEMKHEVKLWKLRTTKLLAKPEKPSFTSQEMRDLEASIDLFERYNTKQRELSTLPKQVKVRNVNAKLVKLSQLGRRLRLKLKAKQAQETVRAMLPVEYRELDIPSLQELAERAQLRIKEIKIEVTEHNERVHRATRILASYETQQKLVKQARSTINRLTDEIKTLKHEAKDYEAWKALQMAYGNSGVRLYALNESASVLSAKLTEISSAFYDTGFKFDIIVGQHKLDVNVERKGKVGPVKTLSGSESNFWNLLCAMGLLHILPASMRCDTIILDEIESKMDKRSRDRYALDILPEVQSLVPKVVVLTPLINGELPIKPDYDYRIVNQRISNEYVSKILEN